MSVGENHAHGDVLDLTCNLQSGMHAFSGDKYSRVPNNRPWTLIYFGKKFPPGRAYLGPDVYLILGYQAARTFIRTLDDLIWKPEHATILLVPW